MLSNPINCQLWHHSCIWLEELPQNMVSHPYLIFRNKWDIKHFLFLLTFSYHWKFYMNHIVGSVEWNSPMLVMSFCSSYFTNYEAKHCYMLSNPINCQFWHHSCIWLEELPQNMVSHPYLIFRNKWDIKHFLFLLTFSYHWEILYEPHCQQCWVKFTHAGHVILQLII